MEEDQGLFEQLKAYPTVHADFYDPRTSASRMTHEEGTFFDVISERHSAWTTQCIKMALEDGIDWLIKIDDDELIECTGTLQDHVNQIPSDVQTVVLRNKEAKYSEVSSDITKCFEYHSLSNCWEPDNTCVAYVNGKGMGRVTPHLREYGFHRFMTDNVANNEMELHNINIIHFDSCNFEKYIKKYNHLAKTTSEAVKSGFPFYDESIAVARSHVCEAETDACRRQFETVYKKYKLADIYNHELH